MEYRWELLCLVSSFLVCISAGKKEKKRRNKWKNKSIQFFKKNFLLLNPQKNILFFPSNFFLKLIPTSFFYYYQGSLGDFSAYGPTLKASFNYTQNEINLIASIADMGLFLGITVGYLFEVIGLFWSIVFGTVMGTGGYFVSAAIVLGYIHFQ